MTLYDGGTVLSMAFRAATISTVVGGFIGILLGLREGLDETAMRLLEIAMSIPVIIVGLLIIGVAGSGVARVVHAATRALVAEISSPLPKRAAQA